MNFCTLFDSSYLLKGLVLCRSLHQHAPEATLYILALDAPTYMRVCNLPGVEAVPLHAAEVADWARARENRTWQEYCWTLASQWLARSADVLGQCVYLDADSMFFSSPQAAYEKYMQFPVALTPHRFMKSDEARLLPNGRYNVNFVSVSETGHDFVHEWADLCLEWCYYRNEPGRFGDQLYLDELSKKYHAVDIEELGINDAPWNAFQYRHFMKNGQVMVSDGTRTDPLILYHVHELKHDTEGKVTRRTNWLVTPEMSQLIYEPYEALLRATK